MNAIKYKILFSAILGFIVSSTPAYSSLCGLDMIRIAGTDLKLKNCNFEEEDWFESVNYALLFTRIIKNDCSKQYSGDEYEALMATAAGGEIERIIRDKKNDIGLDNSNRSNDPILEKQHCNKPRLGVNLSRMLPSNLKIYEKTMGSYIHDGDAISPNICSTGALDGWRESLCTARRNLIRVCIQSIEIRDCLRHTKDLYHPDIEAMPNNYSGFTTGHFGEFVEIFRDRMDDRHSDR